MPINTSYGSAIGVIHADGSVASSSIKYDWNGSVFVKTVGPETGLIDASIALIFGQRIANDINAGNVYKYSPDLDPSTAFLSPIQIAVLRLAIDAGTTTAAKAVEVFGNVTITQAFAFAFNAQALPATLTADQEQSVLLADFYGFPLRLRDVLVKPSAYVDSSAHDTASSPWAIPSGTSATTAIATAWATSTVPSIAAAATSTLSGSADATKATPFALTATPYGDLIEKAYLAFFLRPADATGFNYYADKMNASGGDLSLMTAGFGSSPEYLQTYAGFSTAQRINAIYQNLFNRDAEPAGVEYWGSRLDSGTFTINNIAISILVGAQNADATVVGNRVTVAKQFTASFDAWPKVNAYSGLEAAASARALLKPVTDDPATVYSASANRAVVFKTLGATATVVKGTSGDTITLSNPAKQDVLSFSPEGNTGKTDKVMGFSGDKIDLSSFHFTSTSVVARDLSTPQVASASGFFSGKAVVIGHVGSDSYIYIDADKDGSFNPATDAVVQVVGANVAAADLSI